MVSNTWRLLTLPCILLALLLVGSPEFPALDRAVAGVFAPGTIAPSAAPTEQVLREAAPPPRQERVVERAPRAASGPGAILPLYASFAALQALDYHSTRSALRHDARESNPVMAGLVNRPAAFLAVKAATAAGVIYLTERLRSRSRVAAYVLMGAVNSLYAAVVVHNYRVASPRP